MKAFLAIIGTAALVVGGLLAFKHFGEPEVADTEAVWNSCAAYIQRAHCPQDIGVTDDTRLQCTRSVSVDIRFGDRPREVAIALGCPEPVANRE